MRDEVVSGGDTEPQPSSARPDHGSDTGRRAPEDRDRAESASPKPTADRAPAARQAPATASPARCDLCGAPMLDRHCKLVCRRCGYQRDCSDP